MTSIPDQTEKHQCAPVDLSYRAIGRLSQPGYRLALLRADSLLREFLHGRVKMRIDLPNGSRRYYPILAEDVPSVLRDFTSGLYSTPPAGIRTQKSQDDPGIQQRNYYAKHHRLAIETEDAVTRTTRLGVIDFDGGPGHGDPLRDPLGAARDTIANLDNLGWPSYLVRSNSGAGYHLYVFFQHPLPSADARRLLAHVLRIAEEERERVEINPLERTGQHGSLIHLPWWYRSNASCNVFIDPATEAEIALPDAGRFRRVMPEQVQALLATLPLSPAEVKTVISTGPAPATSSTNAHPTTSCQRMAPEMATWRDRVQGDRRLIDAVYGHLLTGNQSNGWLECHDPASPTGDRNPSAGVHPHSGVFHSYLRKKGVPIFDMMIELGQVRTIGEAYRRAEEITGILRPRQTHTPAWRPRDRYVKPATTPLPELPEGFPLETARAMLSEIVREEIEPQVVSRQPAAFLLKAGTGVGKSHALVHLVADMAQGRLDTDATPRRTLWLTDSKRNRDELVSTLKKLLPPDKRCRDTLAVAFARSPEAKDPGYCRQFPLTQFLARRRQPVKDTICERCQADARKAADQAWTRLSPEEQAKKTPEDLVIPCAYLTQREPYTTARVVVGTQASFQFGGELIEDFDLVVVDEKAVEMFFTACDITAADIAQWEDRQEKDPELWAVLAPVLSLLKQALVTGKAEGVTVPSPGVPLLPLLRQLQPRIDAWMEALWSRMPSDRWGPATPFDAAETTVVWQRQEAPLLILQTLVNLLTDECRRGQARDTQCWLIPPSGDAPATLHLTLIREDLLQSLQQCVVVFLEATAHVPTLQRLWRHRLRVYDLPVQPHRYTTIFTDLQYHTEQLTGNPEREATLLGLIRRLCAPANKPMIICEKALLEAWKAQLPPHALVTYWGAADMAGSNRFQQCDLYLAIGHPRGKDEVLIRQTVAARVFAGNCEPMPAGYDHFAKARIPTPYAGYHDTEGQAWVRMVTYPVDPDACDRVLNSYATAHTQAGGRVRPADPRPYPIPCYLLCGEAPRDWRIDAMATLDPWMAPVEHTAFREAGARSNTQRADATRDQYRDAGRRLHAEHKRVSISNLQRECGGSRSTAQKYYPDVLQDLGIPEPQPFRRPRHDAEEAYPLYGVYQRGYQQYPGAVDCWERMPAHTVTHWWTLERFQEAYTGRRVLQPTEIAAYAQALPLLQAHEQQVREELDRWDTLLQAGPSVPLETLTEADYWRMVEEERTPEWYAEQAFEDWWRTLLLADKAALVAEKCSAMA